MLAIAQFTPVFGAVLICWIFSVCIHEFAHALVAYWGGDRSVRDKGYLSFNIFSYVHPVTSILIPAAFLAMGGLPLPGGAVQINDGALRSRAWSSWVSAAGPISNLLLFLLLAAIVHPATGIVDPDAVKQPTWAVLLGAMTVLELFSVLFNLLPFPPLDGYGIIEPFLSHELRAKMRSIGWGGLVAVFLLFSQVPGVMKGFMDAIDVILQFFGLPFESTWQCFNIALFGELG